MGRKQTYFVVTDPKELVSEFKVLGGVAHTVVVRALKDIAKQAAKIYYENIRKNSFGLKALSPHTITFRRKGKLAGDTPARSRVNRVTPLYYGGQSMKAVTTHRTGKAAFTVKIQEGVIIRYSGRSAAKNAELHENGGTITGKRYTRKQLAYLHIVYRNSGARGKSRDDNTRKARTRARVGLGYKRQIPARPAIAKTRAMLKPFTKERIKAAQEQLKSLTKVRIQLR